VDRTGCAWCGPATEEPPSAARGGSLPSSRDAPNQAGQRDCGDGPFYCGDPGFVFHRVPLSRA
jgi:hypothetical protein